MAAAIVVLHEHARGDGAVKMRHAADRESLLAECSARISAEPYDTIALLTRASLYQRKGAGLPTLLGGTLLEEVA